MTIRRNLSVKKVLQLLGILLPVVSILVGGAYFFLLPHNTRDANTSSKDVFGWKLPTTGIVYNSDAFSGIRSTGKAPQGLPVHLRIPVIKVDAAIEDAFITSDGRMDVPAGSLNVAWFALGPRPGQKGNAVIGGHYGIDNGIPKVFYNLNKLTIGDIVYIENDKNETLAFIVRTTRVFERNADSTPVFISHDNISHLNLIACEGIWNQVDDSYPQRLVVFTDAIPAEGAMVIESPTVTITPLPISSTPTKTGIPTQEETIVKPAFVHRFFDYIVSFLNYQ